MKELCMCFGALSDSTRLKIIQMLTEHEMCVCEIEDRLGMSQPAASHHLGILRRAGLICGRKSGRWNYYSINGKRFVEASGKFKEIALSAIEDRAAKGIPASPPGCEEDSYCRNRPVKRMKEREI